MSEDRQRAEAFWACGVKCMQPESSEAALCVSPPATWSGVLAVSVSPLYVSVCLTGLSGGLLQLGPCLSLSVILSRRLSCPHLFVCQPLCLFCLSLCLYMCVCFCLYLSVCLSLSLYVCVCLCLC